VSLLECPPERRVSAVLFGNRHRLELLAALAHAGDEGVNLSDLANVQGVSANVYYAPLRALLEAGLVERLGKTSGDRRCWYRRRESKVWAGVRFLTKELAEVEVEAW
jgi:DNA-binding transcriptional ArsR family regulator